MPDPIAERQQQLTEEEQAISEARTHLRDLREQLNDVIQWSDDFDLTSEEATSKLIFLVEAYQEFPPTQELLLGLQAFPISIVRVTMVDGNNRWKLFARAEIET